MIALLYSIRLGIVAEINIKFNTIWKSIPKTSYEQKKSFLIQKQICIYTRQNAQTDYRIDILTIFFAH